MRERIFVSLACLALACSSSGGGSGPVSGGGDAGSDAAPGPTCPGWDASPATLAACTNGQYILDGSFSTDDCVTFVCAMPSASKDVSNAPAWDLPAAGAILPASKPPPTFKWSAGHTSGASYMLIFRDDGGNEVLRVLTTATSWKPDSDSWTTLGQAASTVDASLPSLDTTIVAASLSSGSAAPVFGQSRTFYVQP